MLLLCLPVSAQSGLRSFSTLEMHNEIHLYDGKSLIRVDFAQDKKVHWNKVKPEKTYYFYPPRLDVGEIFVYKIAYLQYWETTMIRYEDQHNEQRVFVRDGAILTMVISKEDELE